MKPKKIWSNLTVNDLDRTTKFYTALGFKSNGRNEDLTSFFISEDQFVMHFFLKDALTANVEMEISDAHTANEIVFTLSAESKDEVDQWAKEVEQAGGKIVSQPKAFGAGYYGFLFADPDGHKFNVFYM
ncbi:VOC family protein [Pedobacter psychrodurus]|uniref:VOC family protein n=1 Tax=Pedobacter psychrodurus TaxID=2530456 RepID=UPI00292DE3C8|nr:VOC family protein [Pedobacter psychrodurus]